MHHPEAVHPASMVCDSPLSRQPPQTAQLNSESETLRVKV